MLIEDYDDFKINDAHDAISITTNSVTDLVRPRQIAKAHQIMGREKYVRKMGENHVSSN